MAFAHALAPYPIQRQAVGAPSCADLGEKPPQHVPSFLPAFPDPHTYQNTPAFKMQSTDSKQHQQVSGLLLLLLGKPWGNEGGLCGGHHCLAAGWPVCPGFNCFPAWKLSMSEKVLCLLAFNHSVVLCWPWG